jgi:mevalonate pyrophosphate decarboxylase
MDFKGTKKKKNQQTIYGFQAGPNFVWISKEKKKSTIYEK